MKKTKPKAPPDPRPEPDTIPEYVWSQDEICKFFQVHQKAYQRGSDNPLYPKKTARGYRLLDALRYCYVMGWIAKLAGAVDGDKAVDKMVEEALRTKAQRELLDLRVAEKRGDMITREEHARAMQAMQDLSIECMRRFRGHVEAGIRDPKIGKMLDEAETAARREMVAMLLDDGGGAK